MNIDEFSYLWTTQKEESVLVKTEHGYGIVNKKERTVLLIEDDDLAEKVINKMLQEGNRTYENILEAYNDV